MPLKKAGPKDELKKLIDKEIPAVERVALAAELARGITVQEPQKDGPPRVYTKAPDLGALRFLEEYSSGKPIQQTQIDAGEGWAGILVPPQK